MKRRTFITVLLGGAVAARPLEASAQPRVLPVIGFLHSASPEGAAKNVAAFREGLRQVGYVEGQNVTIEYRWAENQYDRLPALAADLVGRRTSAIVTAGVTNGALAVKRATSTVPIVFISGSDPIAAGLVASLNPRSGNVTGATFYSARLGPKRLELLHELVPAAASVALLTNPDNINITKTELVYVTEGARTLGMRFQVANVRAVEDLEMAFATLAQERIGALVLGTEAMFNNRIGQIVSLAARYSIPTIYFLREFVVAGGLISYGASIISTYRQAGDYAGRILMGAKPSELPIVQPTKFDLVINAKAAQRLGLTVPSSLLAFADEVIE